jgi:spermidine/putrescine transport system permease protein
MSAVGRAGKALLSGYFGLLVAFLYAPLVVLVVFAFNSGNIPTLPIKSFSTKWFSTAFSDTTLTSALGRSALIAALNGLAATILGVMAAVSLARKKLPLRRVVVTLILLPLVVPYIVLAVGLVVLMHEFGITTSLAAVLAGHVVISLPYSVLVILPRLRTLDPSIVEAASDLGASDFRAFLLVTLPLLGPALFSSFLIAFTVSFDEFAIASFLAPPGAPTYPIVLYSGARTPALLPEVIAVGSIVIAISIVIIIAAEAIRRWAERRIEAVPDAAVLPGPTGA